MFNYDFLKYLYKLQYLFTMRVTCGKDCTTLSSPFYERAQSQIKFLYILSYFKGKRHGSS